MPCYFPVPAQIYVDGRTLKQKARMLKPDHLHLKNAELPCTKCLGCRLEKSKEWALRCWHESQLHVHNSFVTLTYDDAHLPPNGSLVPKDLKAFFKKLRYHIGPFRYYACGEYGDKTNRPHYHVLLFGYAFPDRTFWRKTKHGHLIFRSQELEAIWTKGNSDIGTVSFQSAGYVARYIIKKQNGEYGYREYAIPDPATGEIVGSKVPPFTRMSLKPGIGYWYYNKHKTDFFPHDYAVMPNGKETAVPTYYRELLRREDPELYEELRAERVEKAKSNPHNTPERLNVRRIIRESKVKRLERTL